MSEERKDGKGLHIVMTGGDAPEGLIEVAYLVMGVKRMRHPYDEGVRAQKGIEF